MPDGIAYRRTRPCPPSNYIATEKRGRGDAPVARCTCRVAVRSPDERSEELSRSESRKRVRDQVG